MDIKIYLLLVTAFLSEFSVAQEKANEKCNEFVSGHLNAHSITGGVKTAPNEFPHMAALGFGNHRHPEWLCGGALISDQFVLTAAHCTIHRQLGSVQLVRLGARTLTSNNGDHQDFKVVQVIINSNYKLPAIYNDIALLKLERKVRFSKNILPACLNPAFNVYLATNTLTALGWGNTDLFEPASDDLLKVGLRIVQNNQCNKDYSRGTRRMLPEGIKDDTQLCAGGEAQRDTCQGDSGGPLEYKNGKFHYIVGVTSFGRACGSKTPSVYTRVSAFIPWIESVVWPEK